ncbi:nuclear transport factor 2 family protein [Chitinophaga silvatica]|uniref:Nuclear transport factor 2 family protein n=1 Tax=Chitinophaga silvatica TaxID=2282649 RepID=A0A3E1Y460_9BACT|nr:nuclear transport factor 2 family protein [Chitinophaga silvatica]RFS19277.1 nuclear transport factor 2 family protein [Chitinophaga silvatica]
MTKRISLLMLLFASFLHTKAQTTDAELTTVILHKDSLFWKAYNTCDISKLDSFFVQDLEFYHDKGGPMLGLPAFVESMKNLCGNPNFKLRREPIPESIHVFPLRKGKDLYGAILTGVHVFYVTKDGKPEFLDGEASFTHLWLLKDGSWKMSRVLSYDHHAANKSRKAITLSNAALKAFAGKYKGPQSEIEITVATDHLVLNNNGKRSDIYPATASEFFMKERNLNFEFVTQSNVKKLLVKEDGGIAEELTRR